MGNYQNGHSTVFYHGTRAAFRPGGWLLSGLGVAKNYEASPGDRVFVTTNFAMAKIYAIAAKGRGGPRVLVVEPMSRLVPDGPDGDQYSLDMAKVVSVVLPRDWDKPQSVLY